MKLLLRMNIKILTVDKPSRMYPKMPDIVMNVRSSTKLLPDVVSLLHSSSSFKIQRYSTKQKLSYLAKMLQQKTNLSLMSSHHETACPY